MMNLCPSCKTASKCKAAGKCLMTGKALSPTQKKSMDSMGPSALKEDPVYKKAGGKIYNCR